MDGTQNFGLFQQHVLAVGTETINSCNGIYIPASVYNHDKSLRGSANLNVDKVLNLVVIVDGCQAVIWSFLKQCTTAVITITAAVIYNSNFLER